MAPNQARRIPLAPADDTARHSSAHRTEVLMPNLNQVQRDSFDWFMKQGLKEVFAEISPIYAPQHDTEA